MIWCLAGGAVVYLFLSGPLHPLPPGFSAIFWYLLKTYDPVANVLLLLLAVCAFALRKQPLAVRAIRWVGARPFSLAAAVFPLLCLGSWFVYRAQPLSMDEYSVLFQAKVFASGKLSGQLPVELLDRLVPPGFQNLFLTASRATGEVSSTYWPGSSLLVAPFAWLGVPWAANPALAALSIPVIHRLTFRTAGSEVAAAWAVLFTVASPAFVVNALSYYSMTAHLLLNAAYALLLLAPTGPRALTAGMIGGFALILHNPLPHLLFAAPFIAWLILRRGSLPILACLAAGYLPIALVLGFGWKLYLGTLMSAASDVAAAATGSPAAAPGKTVIDLLVDQLSIFELPTWHVVYARLAGATKAWTWGALGIVVLAAWGFWLQRGRTEVRLLASALAATFFGYFLIRFDQGHGWGYRYLHSAWFALPVLAALAVTHVSQSREPAHEALAGMAGWGVVLSLFLAVALRVVQVDAFVRAHLGQVPPLARDAAAPHEVVFVDPRSGFYSVDLIQNHPFLRGSRIIMLGSASQPQDELMARYFPGHVKVQSGPWGEHWMMSTR